LDTIVLVVAELSQRIKALDRRDRGRPAEISGDDAPAAGRESGRSRRLRTAVTIEDLKRFASSRCVGAYLGLRPKRYQSGKADPELRISKAGDPYLRRTLVQSAQYILGHHGPDTALRQFGERLKKRGGRSATKRAAVAVARKLAVLLHRLWVTGERYEPMRGVIQAAAA
jgi:transposase